MPEKSLSSITSQQLDLSWRTNAAGPLLVAQAMLPLLRAAREHGPATEDHPAVIANMSARVGSIGDNRLGGWYAYRASKAALNQLTRTMALELARKRLAITSLLLHPGTCDTDLSAPFQQNVRPDKLFTRERAVRQLLQIIDGATMDSNGKFIAWDGTEIPW